MRRFPFWLRRAKATGLRRTQRLCCLALTLLALSCASTLGQSTTKLVGRVLDAADSAPIAGATLSLEDVACAATADAQGWFFFDNLPNGDYVLRATADGYRLSEGITVSITTDMTNHVQVYLNRKLHAIDGIRVTSDRLPTGSTRMAVVDREQIQRLGARTVAEVLESIEGVYVEGGATAGSPARVHIRGSAAKHVLVMVDGVRINSPDEAAADLNSVPISMVDAVEVYRGGSSPEFGSDALGGAVNIITHTVEPDQNRSFAVGQSVGSWNSRTTDMGLDNPLSSEALSTKAAVDLRQSRGDFDYTYTIDALDTSYADEGVRRNNRSQSESYFLSSALHLSPRSQLSVSFQQYDASNGLPGASRDPDLHAYKDDTRHLITGQWRQRLGQRTTAELHTGYSRLSQSFVDRVSTNDRFDSRYIDDLLTLRGEIARRSPGGIEATLGAEYQHDALDHADFVHPQSSSGRTVRSTGAAFATVRRQWPLPRGLFFHGVTCDGALRYDHSRTEPQDTLPLTFMGPARHEISTERWSPRAGLTLSHQGAVELVLHANTGSSFRLPPMNALFWKGDAQAQGNPDLRPETSRHAEGGFEVRLERGRVRIQGGVTFFHNRAENLIEWVQSGGTGAYRPVNLKSALTTGHEDNLQVVLGDDLLRFGYQNTVTHARNRVPGHNSYDKTVTYTPPYVTRLFVQGRLRPLAASYSVRWVGRRYHDDANKWFYPAYALHEADIKAEFEWRQRWRLTLNVSADNIWNEVYVLIAQNPMPGREYAVGAVLACQLGQIGPHSEKGGGE